MSKGDSDTVEKLLQENRGLREENSRLREELEQKDLKINELKEENQKY